MDPDPRQGGHRGNIDTRGQHKVRDLSGTDLGNLVSVRADAFNPVCSGRGVEGNIIAAADGTGGDGPSAFPVISMRRHHFIHRHPEAPA